eukprot:812976-Pyramimonas_sp.AAC.1
MWRWRRCARPLGSQSCAVAANAHRACCRMVLGATASSSQSPFPCASATDHWQVIPLVLLQQVTRHYLLIRPPEA